MSNPLSGDSQESFLQELEQKRERVAARMSKMTLSQKKRAWEREQLDDLDNAIKKLRSELASKDNEPRFFQSEK